MIPPEILLLDLIVLGILRFCLFVSLLVFAVIVVPFEIEYSFFKVGIVRNL